jgi:D-arabinose 1-dehydrogenase-like Zn-dependent alcohol dehydrogenase
MNINAYGAHAGDKPLKAMQITRRAPGAQDVKIDIAYCGVCHSNTHQVRSEWAGTLFPCVPGHEIVGRVSAVGAQVTGFRIGDLVGAGCIVDSCKHCEDCDAGLENYCDHMVGTYNGPTPDAPGHTLGGYSEQIVVHERCELTLVGAPATPHPSPQVFSLITKRRALAGSMIGGILETQEMLDFRAERGIVADIELIRADEINLAYERMQKGDVKYRFVIDCASLAA